MPREASIVAAACRELDRAGAWHFKTHGSAYGRRGIADIVGAYRGRALAIEVKAPGGRPTPLQLHELRRAARAGAATAVVHSAAQVRELLRQVDQEMGERFHNDHEQASLDEVVSHVDKVTDNTPGAVVSHAPIGGRDSDNPAPPTRLGADKPAEALTADVEEGVL